MELSQCPASISYILDSHERTPYFAMNNKKATTRPQFSLRHQCIYAHYVEIWYESCYRLKLMHDIFTAWRESF